MISLKKVASMLKVKRTAFFMQTLEVNIDNELYGASFLLP